jgi:hypothetical protein
MIRYYPLTRIIPNLYTRGNEYITSDGKSYTGRYYKTYDGKNFTGINPVLGTNKLLTPVQAVEITSRSSRSYLAASTQNIEQLAVPSNVQLEQLQSHFPVPIPSDYSRGYFTRYFAKNVTGTQYIIEVSQMDYAQLENGNVSPNMLSYETTSMLWQLTGPLNDTRVSQYQITGGVFDTNRRVTLAKEKSFTGIVEFIGGDYIKFAKITGGSVANSGSI